MAAAQVVRTESQIWFPGIYSKSQALNVGSWNLNTCIELKDKVNIDSTSTSNMIFTSILKDAFKWVCPQHLPLLHL